MRIGEPGRGERLPPEALDEPLVVDQCLGQQLEGNNPVLLSKAS